MKTATLTLKRNVLVIEAPEGTYFEVFEHGIYFKDHLNAERKFIEGSYTLLGKPDEIKEEDVAKFVHQSIHTNLFAHYVKGIPVNTYCYKTALESFNSALEKEITEPFDFKRTLIFIENEKL